MILATDVQYDDENQTALAAGLLFQDFSDENALLEKTCLVENIAEYIPGQFYLRERPCLLQLLEEFEQQPSLIIVDGYVDLRPNYPGLGRYLYQALDAQIPIIGVAKSHFYQTHAIEIFRNSTRPLFVTAVGIDPQEAAKNIQGMHGEYRIPTLLKRVDSLCRGR